MHGQIADAQTMDGQIEGPESNPENRQVEEDSRSAGHLMCHTSLWGIAGFVGCAYFAWVSFAHVLHNDYKWPHDAWTAATYLVWILLLAALTIDTDCLRERFFFGVLVVNFLIGGAFTFLHSVTPEEIGAARVATGILWAMAALLSLTTLKSASRMGFEDLE